MAYLCWDIDTSIFGVYSLTTLPSHYGDFMRQPRRVRASRSRCDGSNRCNRANRVGEGVHVLGAVSVGLGAFLTTLPLHYGDFMRQPRVLSCHVVRILSSDSYLMGI